VARVAALVCSLERSVSFLRLRDRVTRRAGTSSCVMVFVAIPAYRLRRCRRECNRRGVALEARPLHVQRVKKLQRPGFRLMARDCDGGRDALRRRILCGAVARPAPRAGRCLMMADGAASRSLEREKAVALAGLMTHEARQFLVPRVWKAVGLSRGCRGRADS
jgi:hypothetical protein